jgi:hypothetical protein
MDRSFLSQPEVIASSRQLICVRLTTYEDQAEGAFLKSLNTGRSGELENSVFGIFTPDGKEQLIRPARGMRQVFADSSEMAAAMNRLARKYPPTGDAITLPRVANLRLALDVAASDNQPLVILAGNNAASRRKLEGQIATLAWDKEFVGRFVYVASTDPNELKLLEGVNSGSEMFIVQPDKYGLKGKVLEQCGGDASRERLADRLRAAAAAFMPSDKSFANHVLEGQRLGHFWETVIPVTDPMEKNARERGRTRRLEPE